MKTCAFQCDDVATLIPASTKPVGLPRCRNTFVPEALVTGLNRCGAGFGNKVGLAFVEKVCASDTEIATPTTGGGVDAAMVAVHSGGGGGYRDISTCEVFATATPAEGCSVHWFALLTT